MRSLSRDVLAGVLMVRLRTARGDGSEGPCGLNAPVRWASGLSYYGVER